MMIETKSQQPLDAEVLSSWRRFQARDGVAVLATLVAKEGSSPRPLGSQIAISAQGEAVGYITGGCAEAAIAAEGVAALEAGSSRVVRFGEGSRYVDVKLPCGAGIDVAFTIDADASSIDTVLSALSAREVAALYVDTEEGRFLPRQHASPKCYHRYYTPNVLLDIVGKGPIVPALAQLASAACFDFRVASPETETLRRIPPTLENITALRLPCDYRPTLDRWSAGIVLFHEHDWEPEILEALLSSDAFYIGALGSRRTHEDRRQALRESGYAPDQIARIAGPVGFDIDAASPEEIAISILAEVIAASHRKDEDGKWRR